MKYARGLFDRSIGFLSANEVNKEFIALIEPFHCEVKTCSKALFDECSKNFAMELIDEKKLFSAIFSISKGPGPLEDAMLSTEKNLYDMASSIAGIVNCINGK